MEAVILMLKGLMSESSDEVQALYKGKLAEYNKLLVEEDNEESKVAIACAMFVAINDSGLMD